MVSSYDSLDGTAVRLSLVGRFEVRRGGVRIDLTELGSRKARTLLKLLAVERGHLVQTDRIVDILWNDHPPAQASENVATLISRLRKTLGASALAGRGGYRLGELPFVVVDVDDGADLVTEAERRLTAAQPALAAAAAARALDLLAGGRILEDEPDAAWSEHAEVGRATLVRRARRVGAQANLACDDPASAIAFCEAAIIDDPLDEAAHRLLMAAHAAAGEPARAVAAYTQLRELFDRELGVEPAPATRDLYVSILREDALPVESAESTVRGRQSTHVVSDLSGREAEVAQLSSAWTSATAGEPRLVVLVGEAGIGKTRLAAEVVAIAEATGGVIVQARCYEAERGLFLQPIIDALTPVLSNLATPELRRIVGDAAPTLTALIPALESVLRPGLLVRGLPDLELRRAFDAVADIVVRLSGRAQVLVFLDDLQNAGRATVELLHYMSRRLGGSRVLVLTTIRREEGDDAMSTLRDVSTVVDVDVLSLAAVTDLATRSGQAHLVDHIVQRTRGHTLYVVETLASLSAGRDGVPESLQAAVLARVQRAGPDIDVLLRAAAILGATLDPVHLAALLGVTPQSVLDRCSVALAARLLVVSDRDFEFANDLMREVLYESTPPPTRLAWHRRAADLLADYPEALGAHAAAYGDWSRAARAWLLAAEEAMRRFATADAEALVDRAIEAAQRGVDLEITARAFVVRGRARDLQSNFAPAMADFETALGLAREAGDQRVEMIVLKQLAGDVTVALGLSVAQSVEYLERGLALAQTLGDRSVEVGLLSRLAVIAANRLCFTESLEYSRRSVTIARTVRDEVALAAALDGLKTGYAYLGEIDDLNAVLGELEPLLRRQGDLFRLHWAVFESAFSAIAAGDWDAAIDRIEAAADINRAIGYTANQPWYDAHLGWVERMRGAYNQALFYGRRSVQDASRATHPWWHVVANTMLATTLLELGERAEAIPLLEQARQAADRDGAQAYLLLCVSTLAEATGSRQTLDEADLLLHRIAAPAGSAWLWGANAYLAVARGWLASDEPARARDALAPLLAAATRIPWVRHRDDAIELDTRAAAAERIAATPGSR
jgi:DNA-binding SARP family transcriptional activator/tetratricopeptide (TPR) repeat protein